MFLRNALALIVGGVAMEISAAAVSYGWRDTMPAGPDIEALGYGEGRYFALSSGRFAYSSNAIDWVESAAPTNRYISDVVFANGRFVAVGLDPGFSAPYQERKPIILVSTNGTDWASHQAVGSDLQRIAYGKGVFVAAGNNTLLTSTNDDNWVSTKPGVAYLQLNSVEFVGDRFLALGSFGLALESTNGISWNTVSLPTSARLFATAQGEDMTVVVGDGVIFSRSLERQWSESLSWPGCWIKDVAFGNGRFVAVGVLSMFWLSTIHVSTNGIDWTSVLPGGFHPILNIVFLEGQFVATGNNGTILTSTNGFDWTIRRGGVPTLLWSVAEGNGTIAAVGGFFNGVGTVLTTSGDLTWQSQPYTNANYLLRVLYTNGTFLAVGSGGRVSISADGKNWAAHTTAISDWLYDVIYARGTYVSVAHNQVQWSTNGVAWTQSVVSANAGIYLSHLGFGNDTFVAIGEFGEVFCSTNLLAWVPGNTGSTQRLSSIAFGRELFVAVGDAGTILRSSDGMAWTSQSAPTTNALNGVRFIGDRFIAVGNAGTILSSVDGVAWEVAASGVTTDLYDAAFAQNRLWIVGWKTVLISDVLAPCLSSSSRLPDGRFRFHVDFAFRPYTLQVSSDCQSWEIVPNSHIARNGNCVIVTTDPNASTRLYRALIE
jgi:hypothetical protein